MSLYVPPRSDGCRQTRHSERRHVPPELVDSIIDYLRDDHTTLASCALANRSWLARSRLHLFQDLRVDGSKRSTGCFRRLVQSPQSPCQPLCHLYLHTCPSVEWPRRPRIDAEYLSSLFEYLPNLRTFSISGARFGGNSGYRGPDAPRYKLDKLTMSWVGSSNYSDTTFLEIFALFSDIDRVHLLYLGFGYYFPASLSAPFPGPPVRVRSLTLERTEETVQMLRMLRPILDPISLRSLSVSCDSLCELRELGEFLVIHGSNVVHFELDLRSLTFADSE